MRREFGKFGEIKNLFDLVDKRGMVFLTYYDIRAAEKAKQEMQGSDLAGRKIDVHFSLPKEEEENQKCDRDKNQGTLFITLRDGKDPLDNDELMKYFSQFGDVKIIREYKGLANALNPNPNAASQRFVEFYDSRACVDAYDATMGLEWHGGTFDVKFAWDQSLKDRHEAFNAKRERPPVEHHNRPPQRFQERHDGPRYDREPPWERDRDDHRGRQHYEDYRGGYDEEDYYTPRGYEQDNRFGGGYDQGPLHRPPFHPSPGPQASYPQPFSPPQQHLPSFSTPMQQQPYLPTLSAAVSAALAPAVPAVPAALANLSQMTEQQRLEQAQKAQQFLNLFAQQTQQQQVGLAQAPVPTTPTMPPPVLSIPAPAPVVATQTPATTAANQQATALQLLALLGQVQQQQQLQQSQEQIQPASAAAVPLAQFNQLTQLLQQQRSAGGMAGSPSSQAYVPHGYGGQ
ncbi:hypothetical protein BC938DRAFT_477245 [Jimgerdemannia flammicorona]|uniref:RRM domain-containing protein n=1 Tax=Jimgerdemannia flammicorona TaxID=994334 RepID=A0A433QPJ4_9FUNG|nr:hypothetical protein BC938DRAFT_477245 [Jimgerdemannia flammicorona]